MSFRLRYLARQFARPSGLIGQLIIAPWLDRIAAPLNALTFDQLDVQRDDRLLEIGFGGGDLLFALLRATSGPVTGVDHSPDMVRRARRRFRRFARLRLHIGSVDKLPFAQASFDKVCSVNSLYFWDDPGAAFAELARVVRPGGRLAIGFEPPEILRQWAGHRFGFRAFSSEEIETLMRQSGFGDIRVAEGSGTRPDRFCCLTGERMTAEGMS